MISRDFEHAYESLVDLVGRISQGKIPQHALGEKVSEWEQADCHCAGTLAEAALKALRYEFAKTGLDFTATSAAAPPRRTSLSTS